MVVLDVLYTALATILVMALLQVVSFFVVRMLHPPEPKVIYRDVPVVQTPPPPPVVQAPLPPVAPPAYVQPPIEELKLPEYEPRQQAATGLRVDTPLPPGLQAISTREDK